MGAVGEDWRRGEQIQEPVLDFSLFEIGVASFDIQDVFLDVPRYSLSYPKIMEIIFQWLDQHDERKVFGE
jgi:hypothetical protein